MAAAGVEVVEEGQGEEVVLDFDCMSLLFNFLVYTQIY